MTFNPNEHLMQIGYKDQAKDYLPVQWRLVWFRELCPEGTIKTKMLHIDLDRPTSEEAKVWNNDKRKMETIIKEANGFVIFQASVTDGKGGIAEATKSEKAASFPDFIEKCETGAVGRALAMLGYGTQFASDDFNEEHRIVDAPVQKPVKVIEASVSRPQAQQQAKPPTPDELHRQRIKAAIKRAIALSEIEKGATDEETIANFLKFAGDTLDANIAAVGQLTKSRLEAIDKYLDSKDQV